MQVKSVLAAIITLITTLSLLHGNAFADTNPSCQPIYGGGTTCNQMTNISLDKKILNPQTGSLVDNLNPEDYKFVPGQLISFQITIKNTSDNTLSNLTLKDIFPNKYLNFYSGPGKFDNNTKALALTIDKLNKNETRDYTIRATIDNQIPSNQTICLTNQAQITQGSQISQDNSQFCITSAKSLADSSSSSNNTTTKGGLPVYRSGNSKHTPSTGPEDLAVFGLIPTGALGWFLRKKTTNTNS